MTSEVFQERSIGGLGESFKKSVSRYSCLHEPSPENQWRELIAILSNTSKVYHEWRRGPLRTRKRDWNNFEHYKLVTEEIPGDLSLGFVLNPPDTLQLGIVDECWVEDASVWRELVDRILQTAPLSVLPPLTVRDVTGTEYITPPVPNLDKLIALSLQKMLPTVKSELSVLNSIYELKDMVSFRSTVKRLALGVSAVGKLIAKARGKRTKRYKISQPLNEILEAASDGWLQWSFNLAPFVSDLLGVYRAVTGYQTRIDGLLAYEGKSITRHYTYLWDEHPSLTETGAFGSSNVSFLIKAPQSDWGGWYGGPWLTLALQGRSVKCSPSKFHAQVRYHYKYSDLQREFAHSFAFADSLGINLNPSIIWNAIPWSFVVDWVTGVSRWLDDHRVGNMDPDITIERYMYSIRRERRVQYFGIGSADFGNSGRPVVLPPTIETSYQRRNVPVDVNLLQTSGLSLKEFSLGAALVFSRKRRHRRGRRK